MDNSITRLFDEINEKNTPKRPLTLTNVTPLTPEVIDDGKHNTKLTLQAVPGRAYRNTQDIYYKRINLPDVVTGANIRDTQSFTQQLVVDLLNSQFALFLTLDDLETFTVPTLASGEGATITLTSKVNSIGFTGSLDVALFNGKPLLEGAIGVRILSAYKHPVDPTAERISSRMVTWGIDFTSLRDSLKINTATGSYSDWDTFQAACAYLGVPTFSQGTLTDHSTADIADSNPAFQRVTIQRTVNSSGVSGPLYFHYNLLDGA